MGRPWLLITVDPGRGLALVKGRNGIKEALAFLGVDNYGWSPSKRGWVIPADRVKDLAAYGQWRHELVIVHGEVDREAS